MWICLFYFGLCYDQNCVLLILNQICRKSFYFNFGLDFKINTVNPRFQTLYLFQNQFKFSLRNEKYNTFHNLNCFLSSILFKHRKPDFLCFCFQLVSAEILEKHQAKSLKEAQTNSKNSFICKSPDCKGWWELSF